MRIRNIVILAFSMSLMACSWVDLSPKGKLVHIVKPTDVANCKKLGTTNVSVADKVIGLQRKQDAIQKNLDVLARNAAADMGGDTITPTAAQKDGKQSFDVYRCNGI